MTTARGPKIKCAVCCKEVQQNRQKWYHDDRAGGWSEACVVEGSYVLEMVPDKGEMHCDFCNEVGIKWKMITSAGVTADMMVYQEETLEIIGSQTHHLDAEWAACEECHRLLQVGQWKAVGVRFMAGMEKKGEKADEEMMGLVLEMWAEVEKLFVRWEEVEA